MTDTLILLASETEKATGLHAIPPIAAGLGTFVILMAMLGVTYAFKGLSAGH